MDSKCHIQSNNYIDYIYINSYGDQFFFNNIEYHLFILLIAHNVGTGILLAIGSWVPE